MSGESAVSRPSLTNCADSDSGGVSGSTGESGRDDMVAIRGIVEKCRESSALAQRAMSVVPEKRLRKECTREIRSGDGGYRSRVVVGVLKAFLRWYVEQRDSQLVFNSPEGEEVSAPLPCSFKEEYGRQYYGRLKDLEREFIRQASEPHTAMLTLTGSSSNANGSPRCPADHIRDIQDSWGDYVRRELQRELSSAGFERYDPDDPPEKWWEYATVVEPQKSGYGHFHVAVFTSEEIGEEMFHSVIDKHIEKCDIAASKAHAYEPEMYGDSPGDWSEENKPISVRSVDTDSPEGTEAISNLGSYLSEYIGAFEGELLDREVTDLIFFATLWATNTQRVRFSVGANELASEGQERRTGEPAEPPMPTDPEEERWTLEGIRDPDGGMYPPHTGGGIEMVPIEGAPNADPPPIRE